MSSDCNKRTPPPPTHPTPPPSPPPHTRTHRVLQGCSVWQVSSAEVVLLQRTAGLVYSPSIKHCLLPLLLSVLPLPLFPFAPCLPLPSFTSSICLINPLLYKAFLMRYLTFVNLPSLFSLNVKLPSLYQSILPSACLHGSVLEAIQPALSLHFYYLFLSYHTTLHISSLAPSPSLSTTLSFLLPFVSCACPPD